MTKKLPLSINYHFPFPMLESTLHFYHTTLVDTTRMSYDERIFNPFRQTYQQ